MAIARNALVFLALAMAVCTSGCKDDLLEEIHPILKVTPSEVHLTNVAVAADTAVSLTLDNPALASLEDVHVELEQPADPAFKLQAQQPTSVPAGGKAFINLVVRPLVVAPLEVNVIVTAREGAVPSNRVVVPVTVEAADLGLPDIEVTPGPDVGIDFDRVGRGDVVRASVTIKNVGVRDLLIDETILVPDVEGDASIKLASPVPAGFAIQPTESISLDLAFAPADTVEHKARLRIASNDPDESPLELEVRGQGQECPTAIATAVDAIDTLEPLDTIRVDGSTSTPAGSDTFIERYEWTLERRPLLSTSLVAPANAVRGEVTFDVAGEYVVRLDVYDNTGVRSCEPALLPLRVQPKEDLQVQLVWNHPSADLDLHILRAGGQAFDHDGDCYFSNRTPNWYPTQRETNPRLDVDDDRGYGPENANIVKPLPGSTWTVLVHYWNKKTDGDPRVTATVRLFVFGQQAIELSQTFEDDQVLWHAVEIVWPDDPTSFDQPALTQLGVTEGFARPF
jgi:hypothetical protein